MGETTMFKAPVYTAAGEKKGERDLPETLFDGVVHETAMWQAVKAFLANQRQATASVKTRSEVSGGSRKPWRQKGTGRARQGTIRAAHWRGGGSVFGPRPGRNYREKLPRAVRRLARRSALNARAQENGVVVIDVFDLETPKTRTVVQLLETTGLSGNVLVLTDGNRPVVHRSARNLPGVQVRPFGEESTYDVLWSDSVIIEGSALDRVQEASDA
jgi:large subunit ribosomal protein L4